MELVHIEVKNKDLFIQKVGGTKENFSICLELLTTSVKEDGTGIKGAYRLIRHLGSIYGDDLFIM